MRAHLVDNFFLQSYLLLDHTLEFGTLPASPAHAEPAVAAYFYVVAVQIVEIVLNNFKFATQVVEVFTAAEISRFCL